MRAIPGGLFVPVVFVAPGRGDSSASGAPVGVVERDRLRAELGRRQQQAAYDGFEGHMRRASDEDHLARPGGYLFGRRFGDSSNGGIPTNDLPAGSGIV